MTELSSRKRSKAVRHSFIEKLMKELEGGIKSNNSNLIEGKLEVLKIKEVELSAVHQQLEALDDSLLPEDLKAMEDFRAKIILIKVAANRALRTFSSSGAAGGSAAKLQVKLPKLLKRFEGSIRDWERFWNQYESGVHNNSSLTDVDKMNYLKSLLCDNAALTIAGLQLTAANYKIALDLMKQKYGRPDVPQEEHFNSLLRVKRPVSNNAADHRKLLEEIKFRSRAFLILGKDLEQCSGMICPIPLQMLPEAQIKEWYRNSSRCNLKSRCWRASKERLL